MELLDLRNNLNEIDNEIIALFKKRMGISLEVAKYKEQNNMNVLDTERERELLNRVAELAGDEFDHYARILYTTIMDISRSYQHTYLSRDSSLAKLITASLNNTPDMFPKKAIVACQGVEGAYSQHACEKIFGAPSIVYFASFDNVFSAVDKGLCQYGILPIENSTAGSVNHVYDLMEKYNYYIVRSTRLKVEHSLLAKKVTRLNNIKEIFSHPQAIEQCGEFLSSLEGVKVTVCENTAAAAKSVAESDREDIAAIASSDCAALYSLGEIADNIQNSDNNHTRFICISKNLEIYPGSNRTSLVMTIPHKPGSLYNVMARISALNINLQKLESRPLPGRNFEFAFYFDIDCSVYDPAFTNLMSELDKFVPRFSYLGSYAEVI